MSPQKVVKGEARKLIMDTAEALFAAQGIEGVSLRTINSAAGVSPGVLHYHFGSREVLVAELINRHMAPLSDAIMAHLRPLKQQAQPAVSDILQALILPLAELGLQQDAARNNYLSFVVRLHLERSPLLKEVSARYQYIVDETYALFEKALPTLDAASIEFRLGCGCDIALQKLALITDQKAPPTEPVVTPYSDQQQLTMLLDFLTAAITGIKPD